MREELSQLHEPGSYVGEVVKPMGKLRVLVLKWKFFQMKYTQNISYLQRFLYFKELEVLIYIYVYTENFSTAHAEIS